MFAAFSLVYPAIYRRRQKKEKKWVVVIDASHGGRSERWAKEQEKDLTLAIALKTGKYIEDNLPGVTVIYTRKNDTFVELYRRAEIANKAKADLFIQFISAAV
ncbi:MAG: N-acetylmuramoyl-L-alanine amidase [Bacteroidales bacterium]